MPPLVVPAARRVGPLPSRVEVLVVPGDLMQHAVKGVCIQMILCGIPRHLGTAFEAVFRVSSLGVQQPIRYLNRKSLK